MKSTASGVADRFAANFEPTGFLRQIGRWNNMTSYGKFDEYVSIAAKNQEKAAEIVARSFYRILRKNGFSDSQIINVANNMLDCLINAFEGYKEKLATKEEKK